MRFRVGLTIGFATGYVLGTKAGRERYEQIRQSAEKLFESPPAGKIKHQAAVIQHQAVDKVRAIRAHRHEGEGIPAQEPFAAASGFGDVAP